MGLQSKVFRKSTTSFHIYPLLAFQGPLGPEMLALRLAFRANLFQTNPHAALCI